VPWPPVNGWKERLMNGEPQQSIQNTLGAIKGPQLGQLDLF